MSQDQFASLHEKVLNKSAVVGIIGLGYVGLPLIDAFHRAGFKTIGFDVDEQKVCGLIAVRATLHIFPAFEGSVLASQ